jgi:hypothetical protein
MMDATGFKAGAEALEVANRKIMSVFESDKKNTGQNVLAEEEKKEDDKEPPKTLAGLLLERLLDKTENAESTIEVLIDMDLAKEENRKLREEFARTKGCHFVVEAMKQHSDSVTMQWKSCKLLLFLTYRHDRNNASFHRAGAANVVVEAMMKHPDNRDMQYYGCGALCNLAFFSADNIVAADGILAVAGAMKSYPDDENVQVYGCGCLKALAAHGKFKRHIFDSGGPMLLVGAENRFHGKSEKVETVAHEALQFLYSSQ